MILLRKTMLVVGLIFLLISPVYATKPGELVNPNGFPAGEHFNLNIIAKGYDFSCPTLEYDEYGDPIYGNVIFIPEYPMYEVKILMESGRKGPKSSPTATELEVTDTCTGFDPNDSATLRLPKNDNGYAVYARALAKPSKDPDDPRTIEIFDPELVTVEDEYGNDLLYLGLVTDNGFQTTYAEFSRKPGKSKAVDISGLFKWTGTVCYLNPLDSMTDPNHCCVDLDFDGIYDECTPVTDPSLCEGTLVYCENYTNTWVFNIADFVDYLWNIDNSGVKLLQVRFYPQ
jgi:hypothetical protein